MRPDNTGKKSKTDDPLSIFMFQAFIIDQGDPFVNNSLQHFLILWLFLFRVREKKISLAGQQLLNGNFFDPKKNIAFAYIIFYFYTGIPVFTVGKAAY